ncbi:uncharacterized protein LOC135685189 isoform X2 [Rhopilema esculentum]|uniref:uncharacterized protein LOC135685189 isoform X2 n=1 Tax=Rhopilema esculentum TaxID=499914 RepID=UPI0031DF7843
MFCHKSLQVFQRQGRPRDIFILEISKKYLAFLVYDVFLYILESIKKNESTTTSRPICFDWQLKRIWMFRSNLVKAVECEELECLLLLTADGTVWKLSFAEISSRKPWGQRGHHHDEANKSSARSEIFAALLDDSASEKPKYARGHSTNIFPSQPDESCKLICDMEICEMFCIGQELIVVKQSASKSHTLHKVKIEKDSIISQPFLEVRYLQRYSSNGQNVENTTLSIYFDIISHNCSLPSNSGLTLGRDLFASTFSICNASSTPYVLLCANAVGKICTFPFRIQSDTSGKNIDKETIVQQFGSKTNFLCDLHEPLCDTLRLDVKEINVQQEWDMQEKRMERSLIESLVSEIRKKFEEKCALLIIAKSGKVLIVLQPEEKFNMSPFNVSCVPGPVFSVSSAADFLIHATGVDIHISNLFLDIVVKRDKNFCIAPHLKPVYTISSLSAICLSQRTFLAKDHSQLSMFFIATNKRGCLYSVALEKLLKPLSISKTTDKERMKSLLSRLEMEQKNLKIWEHLLQNQNKVLSLVWRASSVTINLMKAFYNAKGKLQNGDQMLSCRVRNALLETDNILYLDIELQNKSDHLILEYWNLQCTVIARQVSYNSCFGDLKMITKSFRIQHLPSRSNTCYRWSLDASKAKILLPLKLEFKLVFPCPTTLTNFYSTRLNEVNESCIFLPLNVCHVNILDLSNANSRDTTQRTFFITREIFSKSGSQTMCNCKRSFISSFNQTSEAESQESSVFSAKPTKKLLLPISAVSCFSSNENKTTSLIQDAWSVFISNLFPHQSLQERLSRDGCIAIVLPCMHEVKFYIVEKDRQSSVDSPSIFIEGQESALLIQSHTAVMSPLEKSISKDSEVAIQTEAAGTLKHIKDLKARINNMPFVKTEYIHVEQILQWMMDLFFNCRSSGFL